MGQLLKKLIIELLLPYDASIGLLDTDPKEQKAGIYRYLHNSVHSSLIAIDKRWNGTQVSISR